MLLPPTERQAFLTQLWDFYAQHGRHTLPWRLPEPDATFDPYKIFVSELMLQQTQVARVILKYEAFLQQFPTVSQLAQAPLGDVLRAWQGLGYNRRAKYLWQAAGMIAASGWPTDLTKLPGVGRNTAGAIEAYAFNRPSVFVETNIRTVYFHHFTQGGQIVSDVLLSDLVAETLDHKRPREFYWALMDYGAQLKQQIRNISQSAHYTKQTKFEGSERQLRGLVIRELAKQPLNRAEIAQRCSDDRLEMVLEKLLAEGLIVKSSHGFRLA